MLCTNVSEHAVCSIFIGLVNKKNNCDEIARVFIQVKVCLKRSLDQLERGGTGRGHVQVEEQAVGAMTPNGGLY